MKKQINKSMVIYQRPDIDVTDLNGEKVLMDLSLGQYFVINGVGGDIWDLSHEPISITSLIKQLRSIYNVDEETCELHVYPFIERLYHAKLIEVK